MSGSVKIIGWGESKPIKSEMVDNDTVLEMLRRKGVDTKGKTGKDTEELMGIRTRWLSELTSTQHAFQAAKKAIARARKNYNDFDVKKLNLIYSGGSSPDFVYPACSCELQGLLLPMHEIEAADISLACTSFIAAICLAKSRMKDKGYRYALVAVGEQLGRRSNAPTSLNYCLWGTGGGAVVLEYDPDGDPSYGIIDETIISDGAHADWTRSRKLGCHPDHDQYNTIDASMEGRGIYIQRYGLSIVPDELKKLLCRNEEQLDPGGPPWLIPHNSNNKMQVGIGKELGIPPKRVLSCIKDRGNTSSASVAITLARYADRNKFKPGDLLLLAAFGGGMSMGFILYRWPRWP